MVGLNEPELFERLKYYNLKNYCHKVSAALLSALSLYFHVITLLLIHKESSISFSLIRKKTKIMI